MDNNKAHLHYLKQTCDELQTKIDFDANQLNKVACPQIVLLKHYFDKTKGYEGEGPNYLTIMSLNITGGKSKEEKYLAIEQFCEENNIDIVFLQETHSDQMDSIQKCLAHTNTIVFEAINPQNSNKNGVAIMIRNSSLLPTNPNLITFELMNTDLSSPWNSSIHNYDAILGRWIHVKIKHQNIEYNLVNVYAPSDNQQNKNAFYTHIKRKWST